MSERHRAYEWQGDMLILNLRVQPRASRDHYQGIHGDQIRVRITGAPIDGNANNSLIDFLSVIFGVPKSRITLASGSTSRNKRVRIDRPHTLPPDINQPDDKP